MVAGFFEVPAALLAWFYSFTHSYGLAIALIAVVVMVLITPLTLKSTKGMLEMQRLAPEMRKLQAQHRNDRQKLNEEMMKLYQEHKVNPMASCLPLLAQMPVFIIMFRIIHGLTYEPSGSTGVIARATLAAGRQAPAEVGFLPRYLSVDSDLWQSLARKEEMKSFGLDLAKSPASALADGLGTGLPYVLLVVALAGAVFLAAADGRRPCCGKPDDVTGAAEDHAVPARRVRRFPGVLPHRSRHLLHRSSPAAHRPTGLHHPRLLRP
jgi:YidC/Oxa1 family membrane protein insertase